MTDSATPLQIEVNGRAHQVEATPDTPLLYVLRNELGLNGAKYGCGLGVCGACAVLIEGQAVRSCMVPVGEVAGEVSTLEGLGTAGHLHPLQRVFLDEQAAQCGYCTSGMIVTAAALLAENPEPTEDAIRAALDETLCRCGSHGRIVRAVQRAAKVMCSDDALHSCHSERSEESPGEAGTIKEVRTAARRDGSTPRVGEGSGVGTSRSARNDNGKGWQFEGAAGITGPGGDR